MAGTDLTRLRAHEMAAALRAGDVSARELLEASLARIRATDRPLHAWASLDDDGARDAADAADGRLAAARGAGEEALAALPGLLGIPVALKDLVVTRGRPSTAGSRILEGFVGPYDAHIAERLDEAGAVVPGKTNMDEFAMGSSTEHSAWGPTSNPWDLDAGPGRQQRWLGGRRGRLPRAAGHRHGHGRLDPPAGGALRRRRPEADLRARQPLRDHRLRQLARPDRPVRPRHARRRHAPPGDRRARRARLDLRADPGPRLVHGAGRERRRGRRLAERPAPGPAAPVLRQGHGAGRRGPRARGGRGTGGCRRHGGRGRPAAHRLRPRDLLHRRARRGIGEPRPLRRRALRLQRARGRRARQLPRHARAGASGRR